MRTSTLLAATATMLFATQALATSNFPGVIQTHLALAKQPECKVCHSGGITASGTVTTAFGTSMRGRGLKKFDEASLKTALDALKAEKTDSNKDGTTDIDALVAGADPNVSTANADTAEPVEYGCANVSGSSPGALFTALLVAGAVVLPRRRTRRSPQ